jgi:autotransporter-associated beta strand protein
MVKKLTFLLAAVVSGCVLPASAAYQTWTNDVWLLDNNGNPVMAQAGGITKVGNTYYWYGIQYPNDASYYKTQSGKTIASGHGIKCYSSTDLVHWTFVSTLTTHQSTGRMGEIAYNSTNNQYVIWANNGDGTPWCYTNNTLTGNYGFYGSQAVITNEYTGGGTQIAGDCTLFIDDGGTPYFITADPHGRQHAYVCPLSADYLTIGNAVAINDTAGIPAWPQGQEANNVFERNGIYYYITSDLAGYSYSAGYAVWSANLLSPTSYTADAHFQGTTADYTRYSQVSFGFRIAGTEATNYIMVGDRWCEEDSTYASAGYGNGFSIMCPITFTNNTPYFQSVNMFQVDTVTGKIRPATPADAPTNLTATVGNAQVTLSWSASDGTTAYNVKRSTISGGSYTNIASPTTNNYTDTGVSYGTTYYYVVSSTNVFGESTNSAQVSAVESIGPLITTASVSPNPVSPGQMLNISATVTANTNPVATVTVDVSVIGGLTNQVLVSDGDGNYTNSVTVVATPMVGVQTLTVNASDDLGNFAAPYPFSLTIQSVNETWDGGGGDNNWSDATNWVGNVAPGNGYSLTFAGSMQLTPNMDGSYSINGVTFSNNASSFVISTANSSILTLTGGVTNNSANTQTLNVPISMSAPQIFNAASGNIAIGGAISDAGGGLIKVGDNILMLLGTNTYTGNTTISNGTVLINDPGELNNGAYAGNITDIGAFTYNSSASQTLSGIISGIGTLTNNAGTLTLSSANSYSGGTTVSGGTLNLNSGATAVPVNNAGSGGISLAGGTLLVTSTANSPNTILSNAITVTASSTFALSPGTNNQAQITANVSGTGTLSVSIPSGDIMNIGGAAGQFAGFTGTLAFGTSAGQFKVRTASNLNFGNAIVDMGSGSTVILSKSSGIGNTTQTFGAIKGGATTTLSGPDASGAVTFTYNIGSLNTDAQFDGLIANGSATTTINKIGTGTWTLTHANTYTGNTTVSNGTLLVNGSLAAGSAVVVAAGGTLGGTGIINGAVTVNGTIAPGTNSIGTLTFATAPALNGTNLMEIDRNGGSPLADKIVVNSGALTCGGTLIVTNRSATPLANGDSFQLFNAGSYSGAFANVILPQLPVGLAWNMNSLNTSGTISIVINTTPVIGSISISGNNILLSGAGGVGNANYYLLTSTNIATPLNNWTRLLTNQFDNNGNFNFTKGMNTNLLHGFYIIQMQ